MNQKIMDSLREKADTPEKLLVLNNCIGLVRTGSYLYGTNTKDSDMDYVGFFIAPEEYKLGRKNIELVEFRTNKSSSGRANTKDDIDCTFYELTKWFSLLEGNSPNQLELLFVNDGNKIHTSELFEIILKHRGLFISKKLRHSFCGYAFSQLKKNEIKSGNQTGRKELIAKFGFDTKLLGHALRLYTESLDLLVGGELKFPLPNNQEILAIRRGEMSYEDFQERCKRYEGMIDSAYVSSGLQYTPNYDAIHKMQIDLYKKHYRR